MVGLTIAIMHKDRVPRIARELVKLKIFTGKKFSQVINVITYTPLKSRMYFHF